MVLLFVRCTTLGSQPRWPSRHGSPSSTRWAPPGDDGDDDDDDDDNDDDNDDDVTILGEEEEKDDVMMAMFSLTRMTMTMPAPPKPVLTPPDSVPGGLTDDQPGRGHERARVQGLQMINRDVDTSSLEYKTLQTLGPTPDDESKDPYHHP
jgi:hypothetical protein